MLIKPSTLTFFPRAASPATQMLRSTSAASTTGNGVTTPAADFTGVNLIVLNISFSGSPTLSDSSGNTYTPLNDATASVNGTPYFFQQLFYCVNPTVSSNMTFTVSGSNTFPAIGVLGFHTKNTAMADQQNVSNFVQGVTPVQSTVQPGSITPTTNNQLVVTGVGFDTGDSGAGGSINSNFTGTIVIDKSGINYGTGISYIVQGTAAAVNPTWSFNESMELTSTIASFKV